MDEYDRELLVRIDENVKHLVEKQNATDKRIETVENNQETLRIRMALMRQRQRLHSWGIRVTIGALFAIFVAFIDGSWEFFSRIFKK